MAVRSTIRIPASGPDISDAPPSTTPLLNRGAAANAMRFAPPRSGEILQERQHLGGDALDLLVALLIRAGQVEHQVPHAGSMELADGFSDARRRPERAIALRRLAEIHR